MSLLENLQLTNTLAYRGNTTGKDWTRKGIFGFTMKCNN